MKAYWNAWPNLVSHYLISDKDETIAYIIQTDIATSWLNRAKPPRDELSHGVIFGIDKPAALEEAKIEAEQVARSMGWEFELVPNNKLG